MRRMQQKPHVQAASSRICVAAAVLMLLALFAATALEAHHVDHACTGEECPVCALIATARTALRTLVLALTALCTPLLAHTALEKAPRAHTLLLAPITLVSAKIKLSA